MFVNIYLPRVLFSTKWITNTFDIAQVKQNHSCKVGSYQCCNQKHCNTRKLWIWPFWHLLDVYRKMFLTSLSTSQNKAIWFCFYYYPSATMIGIIFSKRRSQNIMYSWLEHIRQSKRSTVEFVFQIHLSLFGLYLQHCALYRGKCLSSIKAHHHTWAFIFTNKVICNDCRCFCGFIVWNRMNLRLIFLKA